MRILVKVIPKSSHSDIKIDGNVIKVWLHSPPNEGRANQELVRMLAKKFSIAKSRVEILSGFASKNKLVDILGVTDEEIKKSLQ